VTGVICTAGAASDPDRWSTSIPGAIAEVAAVTGVICTAGAASDPDWWSTSIPGAIAEVVAVTGVICEAGWWPRMLLIVKLIAPGSFEAWLGESRVDGWVAAVSDE
jgi:hypothetical protein